MCVFIKVISNNLKNQKQFPYDLKINDSEELNFVNIYKNDCINSLYSFKVL